MVAPSVVLNFVTLAAVLGAAGQGARAVIGMKKRRDEALVNNESFDEWFDGRRLALSFAIGAIAGILGAAVLFGPTADVQKQQMAILIGVGYAGTDFIEGALKNYIPRTDGTGLPETGDGEGGGSGGPADDGDVTDAVDETTDGVDAE